MTFDEKRLRPGTNQPDTPDTDHRGDSGLNDIQTKGVQQPSIFHSLF
jgi:hypothetical protein